MNQFYFQQIQTGTPAYEEMIALRMAVLLDPIGIPRSYIDPQKESKDILIGAYENSHLVGCCILTRIDDITVQLRQMAVLSSQQQKGLGKAILAFAESIAGEQGYSLVRLHARDNVIPFYLKCDYSIVGNPFFEVGIGHHLMQKSLKAANRQ